jgi:hypothetical protein
VSWGGVGCVFGYNVRVDVSAEHQSVAIRHLLAGEALDSEVHRGLVSLFPDVQRLSRLGESPTKMDIRAIPASSLGPRLVFVVGERSSGVRSLGQVFHSMGMAMPSKDQLAALITVNQELLMVGFGSTVEDACFDPRRISSTFQKSWRIR